MERIQALIDKLYQQKLQNVNHAQLLLTVELLRSELLSLQQKNGTLGTSKVAVTLPVNMNFAEEVIRTATVDEVEKPVENIAPAQEETPAPPVEEQKSYSLRKPSLTEESFNEPVSKYAPPVQEAINPAFNIPEEVPTLAQPRQQKELHEVIADKKESLNDKLKQERKELAHALKETPIKDLRKAIGINDRFTFVNELFRGDDAMYERSLKTINSFNIYSEAEYWMNRELKFKLGWNDENELVKHFYDLVRRRFS
jgi:hypothetical protein